MKHTFGHKKFPIYKTQFIIAQHRCCTWRAHTSPAMLWNHISEIICDNKSKISFLLHSHIFFFLFLNKLNDGKIWEFWCAIQKKVYNNIEFQLRLLLYETFEKNKKKKMRSKLQMRIYMAIRELIWRCASQNISALGSDSLSHCLRIATSKLRFGRRAAHGIWPRWVEPSAARGICTWCAWLLARARPRKNVYKSSSSFRRIYPLFIFFFRERDCATIRNLRNCAREVTRA